MTVELKPLAEVTQEAIRVLVRELGPVDTVRFVNQFTLGYGDCTRERDALWAELTLEDVVAAIKRGKEQAGPPA
jgi:hypothetical protein